MTARFDFFYRAERNIATLKKLGMTFDEYWADKAAYCITLEIEADADLEDAIAAAIEAGMPKGSARSGCFEIQGPEGIWSHVNERRINPAQANKITFTAW